MKIVISSLIFLVTLTTNAQVRDLMLKKAGGMLNGKKETTTTDTTQKTTTTTTETQKSPTFNFGMGSKADAKAEYLFSANAYVEIQNYKKSGEKDGDASNVRYHFSKDDYYGTEMKYADKKGNITESFGVAEFSKNQMVSLITNEKGEKTGTVMKIDLTKQVEKHNDTANVKITKTGKTKVILGYTCEEYVYTDDNGNKTEAWMTTGVPYDMHKMFAGNKGSDSYSGYGDGFMMEMTYLDKDGKKTTWKVLEMNLNSEKKVVTGDYAFPY